MAPDRKGGKGLSGPDKQRGDLRDQAKPRELREGLQRPRATPLDKDHGRARGTARQDRSRVIQEGS